MFTRTLFRAAAVAAASLAWAGASAQTIGIAIGSEPTTLDPQLRDDGGERQVNDNIFETLMVAQRRPARSASAWRRRSRCRSTPRPGR